jgi:hypothetical protein
MPLLRLAKKHRGRVVTAGAHEPEAIAAAKRRESVSSSAAI